jgi:Fe-S oxidoreductase
MPIDGLKGTVCLFADEFTNYNESDIGIKAVILLESLGYKVTIPRHKESGRTFLSKGMLRRAKKVAIKNILMLRDMVSDAQPLLGIEPSAILAFRDEYPEMAGSQYEEAARSIARNSFLIEEFICREADKGNISPDEFTDRPLLHVGRLLLGTTRHMLSMQSTIVLKSMTEL